jgi:glyceraldehyde 3-phosphate dehydrogenase
VQQITIGINGFGRIGRTLFRLLHRHPHITVTAINDLADAPTLAHLLKYDTAQGRFNEDVTSTEDSIKVNNDVLKVYAQKDPSQIPWAAHDVDVVLECTGFFTDKAKAEAHITAGAKKVVLSAPAKDDTPTFVMGVNHKDLTSSQSIVSNASCTRFTMTCSGHDENCFASSVPSLPSIACPFIVSLARSFVEGIDHS